MLFLKIGLILQFIIGLLLLKASFDSDIKYGFDYDDSALKNVGQVVTTDSFIRKTISFPCVNMLCEAWLYTPVDQENNKSYPIVVMAHGLGGQKEFGLYRFAEAFARKGIASFVFDYRSFGGSEGTPRNWVSPKRHLADWRSAIDFILLKTLGDKYDTNRIVLWGTSFGGGHAIVMGAEYGNQITAIVTMVPHLDGRAASRESIHRRGVNGSVRMLAAGLLDLVRSLFNQDPVYVRLAGSHDQLAFMQLSSHELDAYYAKIPPSTQGGWIPWALARFTLETSFYRPITYLGKLKAPLLIVSAAKDTLCSREVLANATSLLPSEQVKWVEFPVSHFDVYLEPQLTPIVNIMVDFFKQHGL
uniref:Serine aminopeptidase S33 domain-containing protein n=1 Tax=Polytomella parva TaxID=51329 RepID=A0A7S0VNT9_9CHLO|mmetsp:Transcript_7346/g.14478  ORF Transcript_7346/g.14478 Transcript_7346/m.14478 type:complete len:359 (+) Transcript_7346:139-1215(+)|eukprot:CAMPEP_0175040238 /NCGR_PEP_ID=MMETSP0052_2-20121109/1137_1 /TAXON_ID=51329 ORGANISM="Polytomella parva, Strain SAG 63-3" /NCGR_SAMPLE_ID=MMETSP0052_2 /ASSEMBLY_ACC=CAM_ASM_000194 /LENGTH=358 /DNA_ID=CAMNT_0016302397 /DNA_START=73 /DNA_END=1149 /DNA_ORIENTATION=+